ncbi:phospholipid carrier-dependent glycosyltransferase [uncultured Gilvimarinus sp.]|uniref:phospholipid carrier-dependent glycosyltransferase n=1 Tax=uncultured Gilvimarinus sp. TaxID=1689143 RepID=UPI0030ED956A|tara:strand:+ start:652 stop:2145 length:1494 start_codon:yes stop_codon:yes gene_type:complete
MHSFLKHHITRLYLLLLLVTSAVVYITGYGQPNALFWDENYHISSAEKYIDGVMYMEPHPPLGKLLMAGSEALLGANAGKDKSNFTGTDYVRDSDMPQGGISFYGYRMPSTVLMALSVLFLFGIIRRTTGNPHVALAFCCFLIFDNALVIHARSAMLEGIQLFFILAAIYYAVRIVTSAKGPTLTQYALLGVIIGLAVAVKVNALVLLLLFVMVYGVDQWQAIKTFDLIALIKRLASTVPAGVIPLALTFFAVFYIHIGLGQQISPHKDYSASTEYQQKINAGESWAPGTFVIAMQDNLKYMSNYADGVPRLDVCKDGENGSAAIGWPLGTKTINYRWSKRTIDGTTYVRYHNLVTNPVVWFSVLAGVVLSAGLIIGRFVYNNPVKDTSLFYWICAFTGLYISYMVAILQIERVMYMYHYLVPLVFGIINLALVFSYIFREQLQTANRHTYINLAVFMAFTVGVFFIFAPFTYSWELTEAQFELRDWFDYWKLEVVR